MDYRIEKDSLGELNIENDKYYGVQNGKSHRKF